MFTAVARIGFEREVYVTRENTTEEVCAVLIPLPTLGRQVVVTLQTRDGSATGVSAGAADISMTYYVFLSVLQA